MRHKYLHAVPLVNYNTVLDLSTTVNATSYATLAYWGLKSKTGIVSEHKYISGLTSLLTATTTHSVSFCFIL